MKKKFTDNLSTAPAQPRTILCRATRAIALTMLAVVFASCSTVPTPPKPSKGKAVVDAAPGKKKEDRIRSSRIVAANGQRLATPGKRLEMKPGENEVTVQFDWPQGGSSQATLGFKAEKNRRYYLRYHPYPPTALQDGPHHLTPRVSAVAMNIVYAVHEVPPLAAYALALVPAGGVIDLAYSTAEHAIEVRAQNAKPASYVDLLLVSEHGGEGVVARTRLYPEATSQSSEIALTK